MEARFQIYRDQIGEYRWHLLNEREEIIADCGQGYSSKAACEKGIDSTRRFAYSEVFQDKQNKYRWRVRAINKFIVADSAKGYETEQECLTVFAEFVKLAPSAQVQLPHNPNQPNDPQEPKEKPQPVPPLNHTVSTHIADASRFIYSGDSPQQKGVEPISIDEKRAALLRGRVVTSESRPLSGVEVRIHSQPQYGSTYTDTDGSFNMVVNGGSRITLCYRKDGYLMAQRQVKVPWKEYVWLPKVALVRIDSQVTKVSLDEDRMQVARSSKVQDHHGERQATLMIPKGTQAELVLPNGDKQPLSSISVRATEYTIGESGPIKMPAELPPTSGYTYAVELSADEAIAAGANSVQFSTPIPYYVENFLKFPVGGIVPAGYYDSEAAAWIPSNNGKIIEILRIENDLAVLDVTGNKKAATAAALKQLGITEEECKRLAELYKPGMSLWRVPIPHFTPWDLNWPLGLPDGAAPPGQPDPEGEDDDEDPDKKCASIIELNSQTLGEAIPVTGTPYRLHYHSGRTAGRIVKNMLNIPLTGEKVPEPLKRVVLEVHVAGQKHEFKYENLPKQSHMFTWNGRDGFGRVVQGSQPVKVRIGYVYDSIYQQPAASNQSFAQLSGVPIPGAAGREEITLWQEHQVFVGGWDAGGHQLGGWTLNTLHTYDPARQRIYYGNGKLRNCKSAGAIIQSVAGLVEGAEPSSGRAMGTELSAPVGIDMAPDGSLYIAEANGHRVICVRPNGTVEHVAGSGNQGYRGDGESAVKAHLDAPFDLAVATDGSLYIADSGNNRIRRVKDGIITTIAGNGKADYKGDGGLAVKAQLNEPAGIAFGPDGSLYIADRNNQVVRKVEPNGCISTVAGGGTWGFAGDGGPALMAELAEPTSIDVAPDGSLYIADKANHCIRRVSTSGIISTVAGDGTPGYEGDGGLAVLARLDAPVDLAMTAGGYLYIAEGGNHCIRRLSPDGTIATVSGNGKPDFSGDGGLASEGSLDSPCDVSIGPDGSLYIADSSNGLIRRISTDMAGLSLTDNLIPSEQAKEVNVFDNRGKHKETIDGLTGQTLYKFGYDEEGRLTSVQEGAGGVTQIERDEKGNPITIIAPYGQRTHIKVDEMGYLQEVAEPLGGMYHFSYSNGLLETVTAPNGQSNKFSYDELGRLVRDVDALGGYIALKRQATENGLQVQIDASDRQDEIEVKKLPDGSKRTVRRCCGGHTRNTEETEADGTSVINYPDGSVFTRKEQPDPRFGLQAKIFEKMTVSLPSGLVSTTTLSRIVKQSGKSIESLKDTIKHNGKAYTSNMDYEQRSIMITTPEKRKSIMQLDIHGRVIKEEKQGIAPIMYTYDEMSRVEKMMFGGQKECRETALVYDNKGMISQIENGEGLAVMMEWDDRGQLTQLAPTGQEQWSFAYDKNGNLVSIHAPDKIGYRFTYTKRDELEAVHAVIEGMEELIISFRYLLNRSLASVTKRDGRPIHIQYDRAGRTTAVEWPEGAIEMQYEAKTDRLMGVKQSNGNHTQYSYDGFLLDQISHQGEVPGEISYEYDADMRIIGLQVNKEAAIAYKYDDDGLLISAGELEIERAEDSGFITGTQLGKISDHYIYNAFGEIQEYKACVDGDEVFVLAYERDTIGRVIGKVETIAGETSQYKYEYDRAGRLIAEYKDGKAVCKYAYDARGNRLFAESKAGKVSAVYDKRDCLQSCGEYTFEYTPNGEMAMKKAAKQKTAFRYDALGSLYEVNLPSGNKIEYITEGGAQRIGKKVNGKLVQGFLYHTRLFPAAELDETGKVKSRFVYATRGHAPDVILQGKKTYRIICDAIGSPRMIVDAASGKIAQTIHYDAFGNVLSDTNPGFQPFGFAGGLYDQDTQLVRFGLRDYDPLSGRWTTADPKGIAGGLNQYAYAHNDPINAIDPQGTTAFSIIRVGKALGLAGIAAALPVYYYLQAERDDLFPSDTQDKNRHCWVNCMLVQNYRWLGFTPAGASMRAEAFSLGKEARDLTVYSGIAVLDNWGEWGKIPNELKYLWKASGEDMNANHTGQRYGQLQMMDWWKECKTHCSKCPME